MKAVERFTRLAWAAAFTVGVAACSSGGATDATGPAFKKDDGGSSGQAKSYPAYSFKVDTRQTATYQLPGGNSITFPAGSICNKDQTPYGTSEWYNSCPVATGSVNIVANVNVAGDGTVAIDFTPKMRFVPGKSVVLTIYDPEAKKKTYSTIWYCDKSFEGTHGKGYKNGCVDEENAYGDHSLGTTQNGDYFSRRVLHFSGYNVAARWTDSDF